jgi:hypothetical protein
MLLGKYLNTMDLLIHCFTVDVSILVLTEMSQLESKFSVKQNGRVAQW